MTPLVNHVIKFLLEVWIPEAHLQSSGAIDEWFGGTIKQYVTNEYLVGLRTEQSSAAVLLPCATMLATLSNSMDMTRQRIQLKHETMRQLRANMSETGKEDILMRLTRALFVAAICNGDMAEAKLHGEALQRIMRERTDRDGFLALEIKWLEQTLRYEVHRSDLTLTASVFDVDSWAPKVLHVHTRTILDVVEPLREDIIKSLDATVQAGPLEAFCVRLKQSVWL